MQGPYTVTIEVPYGTIVRNVIGATASTPRAGNNNTLAIDFTSTSTLLANAGDYTFINFTVMAESQARLLSHFSAIVFPISHPY